MKLRNVLFYAFAGLLAYKAGLFKDANVADNVVDYKDPAPIELIDYDAPKLLNKAEIIGRDYAWEHVRDDELHCLHAAGLVADKLLIKYNFGEEARLYLKEGAVRECANVAENNGYILKGKVFIKSDY